MRRWSPLVLGLAAAVACYAALLQAQDFAPPPSVQPGPDRLREITDRADKLERAIGSLRRQGVRDPLLAEVEVYHKAVEWAVRHNEFYDKPSADWALAVLDRGLLRASQQARGEAPWLGQTGHPVVRAYRSQIDNSVQPYAVTFPAGYGRDPNKKWGLDVVLHGRNPRLTEVSFLHQFNGDRPARKGVDRVEVAIYGRGNNAYRWAGERDVYEALDNFLAVERALDRVHLLDLSRVVLRGFSMGGAGTWHLGLHRPDRWCVLAPGAGFTTTRGYDRDLPAQLPPYQEACLKIYDAVEYAENVFNVPVVAFSGARDKQIEAARNIEARLKPLKLSLTHLVAPGLGHRFPPEWQAKVETEIARHLARGRPEYPRRVRFVTYTLRYPGCDWVNLLGLESHYRRALVDAEQTEDGYKVKTENVRALHLTLPPGSSRQLLKVALDRDRLETRPYLSPAGDLYHLYFEKRDGRWHAVLPQKLITDRLRTRQKTAGLQGPIDDAFMAPFLCVRGTGQAWNEAVQSYAEKNLKRFEAEWEKYLRGRLPVKDDVDVTAADIATKHLILFGDPGSNSLIAQVLDGLPLQWTHESVTLAGHRGEARSHVPVLVYPSPLNAERYVVLNSGHTFHAEDFRGTNARLYPRLGDYALLKLAPTEKDPLRTEVARAGLFDDFWRTERTRH